MNPLKRRLVASTVIWASVFSATALIALTGMTGVELTAGENVAAPAVSEDFVYFPSQYLTRRPDPASPFRDSEPPGFYR